MPSARYHYIDADELVSLMDDPQRCNTIAIIDCRDEDRNTGFIVGSLHYPTMSTTAETYTQLATTLWTEGKRMAIFHCALSQVRGPKGANRFAMAQEELGHTFPEVLVLRGGFDRFYDLYGTTRPDLMYV